MMRIKHYVSFNSKSAMARDVESLDLDVKRGAILSSFEIDEGDEAWAAVAGLIAKYRAVDLVYTTFTSKECSDASNLCLRASGHDGYPMPMDDFGYLEKTYDTSRYNERTGTGLVQKGPFRMKSEPSWKKGHFLQLHWVYDVFFVQPETWESVFKPLGIECETVLEYKSESELKTVVQLRPQGVMPVRLDLAGLPMEEDKFLPVNRGFFPRALSCERWGGHFLLSQEYFGSGASAYRAAIVSSDFYRAVVDHKLKGVNFVPMLG